jgi:LPS-assembly lipoprotein
MRTLLIILFCLLLTACGFHIRSHTDLSPQLKVLAIENTDPHSTLTPLLSQNLKELGVTIRQEAPVTLLILNENFSQSKAVLGTAQQVNTVSLSYTVTFVLKDYTQKTLISPITLTTSTSYLQNANQILGDTTMLPSFQQELIRNMTSQILSHLSARNTAHALSY